jgi:hypothetical protein
MRVHTFAQMELSPPRARALAGRAQANSLTLEASANARFGPQLRFIRMSVERSANTAKKRNESNR